MQPLASLLTANDVLYVIHRTPSRTHRSHVLSFYILRDNGLRLLDHAIAEALRLPVLGETGVRFSGKTDDPIWYAIQAIRAHLGYQPRYQVI